MGNTLKSPPSFSRLHVHYFISICFVLLWYIGFNACTTTNEENKTGRIFAVEDIASPVCVYVSFHTILTISIQQPFINYSAKITLLACIQREDLYLFEPILAELTISSLVVITKYISAPIRDWYVCWSIFLYPSIYLIVRFKRGYSWFTIFYPTPF